MSSLDGISTCDKCGAGGGKGESVSTSNRKECTSCEQKNDDGASNNTSGSCNSDIDTVAEGISKVDVSNNKGSGNAGINTAFTFLPPESAKIEARKNSNTKNDVFQFGPARNNSVSNSIDKIANEVDSLGISDEELFANPPPKEDCPICMLPIPCASGLCGVRKVYMSCCGKMLCLGCMLVADGEMRKGNMKDLCPFCRVPLQKRRWGKELRSG